VLTGKASQFPPPLVSPGTGGRNGEPGISGEGGRAGNAGQAQLPWCQPRPDRAGQAGKKPDVKQERIQSPSGQQGSVRQGQLEEKGVAALFAP
jgi:hypothetical protein